jgi:UDP-N-acetylglucosamine:LPS N-acetylglucosamine transferase
MKNARAMVEAGAATILSERDLNADSLAASILNILGAVLNSLNCIVFHIMISVC